MRAVVRAFPWRRVALVLVAGALAVGVAAGALAAGPALASPGADAAAAAVPANLTRAAVPARTIHADLTMWTRDGARTVRYVRGTLTDVGAGSLAVTTKDGQAFAFTVTDTTRVRSGGRSIPFSSLEAGETAMVFGTRLPSGAWAADLVRCVTERAPLVAPAPSATATPAG